MEVRINKEVRNYTESIFFGLSMRQFFFSVVACVIAVVIYFSFIDTLGTEITSWLCIIGAIPFAALGFISFQNLNAEQIVLTAWHSFLLSKTDLIDKPYNLYLDLTKDIIERYKKEALKKHDKKLPAIKTIKQRKI